jgi:hypothetical protein
MDWRGTSSVLCVHFSAYLCEERLIKTHHKLSTSNASNSWETDKYKTLAVPVLLYGAENWTLTVPQKKRIEATEMKLLRPLAGYTLRYHKYDDIRSELGVQSITEILHIYRTDWHDHWLRMEPYRVPLQVYRYRPTGRRNVGRPKKRWKEQF